MLLKSKSYLRIETFEVYKNDVKVTYKTDNRRANVLEKSGKKKQGELSSKSLKKLAFYAQNTAVKFVSFVTLTYPGVFPRNGQEVKRHLNRFLSWMRSKYKGVEYLWFMEFQRRGAPHFHVMTSVDMTTDKEEVSERWYRAVGSGDERHLKAGTNVQKLRSEDGSARYVSKYASKAYQKRVPKDYLDCGRFWGSSRGVKPEPVERYDFRGMTGQDLQKFMSDMGWSYAQSLDKPLTVLYNAAHLFQST